MTIVVEDSTGTNWIADGVTDTFTKVGSDNALVGMFFAKASSTSRTISSMDWGSQAFTVDQSTPELTPSTLFIYPLAGHIKDADIPETSETLAITWTGGSMNEDGNGAIVLLSGVDQDEPEVDQSATAGIQIESFNGVTPTDLTYSANTGDIILYLCADNSEAYGDIAGFTRITTDPVTGDNQLDEGAIYRRVATGTETDTTIPTPIGSSVGIHYLRVYKAAGGASASLDSVDDPIAFGDTINFSHTGFDTITSRTLSDGTNTISLTGNDSAAALGGLDDQLNRVLTGTVTFEISDGTETDSLTTTLNPPAGWNTVKLTSGFDTSESSFLYNFGGTPAIGDEFISQITLNSDGSWEAPSDGVYPIYGIAATDGFMELFTLTVGEEQTLNGAISGAPVDSEDIDGETV